MSTLQETYTAEQFAAITDRLDDNTLADLYSYFGQREPVPNFTYHLQRQAILYGGQYAKMLRDESVEYDAMVTDYLEAQHKEEIKQNNSGTEETTTTGTESGTTGGTDNTTNTEKTTTTANGTSNTNSRSLDKSDPMQNTYSDAAGTMPALLWDTADTQSQTIQDGTTTDDGTSDTSGTTTRTTSGTSNHTTQGTTTKTDSGEITTTHNYTDRHTGRSGKSPAELLKMSREYLQGTAAFNWLTDKMEKCFIWSVEI